MTAPAPQYARRTVVSVDPGSKATALCVVSLAGRDGAADDYLLHWAVVHHRTGTITQKVKKLVDHLAEHEEEYGRPHVVLIENQVGMACPNSRAARVCSAATLRSCVYVTFFA
jgi:Holliday junction resolvasome RuvABC endonuclease subunit